ncbi:hypothetical protein F3Y22_tig00111372pilonHSYRG00235 [Hibiscus syriacus]|uniref:Integrase catalytic domain-containing protein n=1 Tax=Hibiscus syriacus TaxID=106335 RepID=A0A6A2YN46_HIBSY|nr:hypothetical protein F3Y22_tig00111372pilonHSYRG00235 [Hibiscus syriacus]
MTTEPQLITIPNLENPTQTLQLINISHPSIIKLTSSNYLAWKLQIEVILIGYDHYKYIDNTHPCPSRTITTNKVEAPNPAFLPWIRQDKLLFGVLVGSISPSLVTLIQQSVTSREAWKILANTYARPTRGHIKQIKDQVKKATNKPMDHEDIIEKILDGLDDDYRHIADIVEGRDTPISFDELHEKLINRELTIQQLQSASFPHPVTTNPSQPPQATIHQQRPYLDKCQGCRQQGHTVAQCSLFQLVPATSHSATHSSPTESQWHPRTHVTTTSGVETPAWLLDSGASHHVTADLGNLLLHAPYEGPDDIEIDDGTGLHISKTGSTSIKTPSHTFQLHDVLFVPTMKRNLIFISQFCKTSNTSIEFLPSSFPVNDLLTGATLLEGQPKGGVYELPISHLTSRPSVFTSTKVSSCAWHYRLGHPSKSIQRHIVFKFGLPSDFSSSKHFHCKDCFCNKSHKLPFSQSSIVSTSPLQHIYSDVWTSPIYSVDGYKYYLIFVDHFTHYIWLYPLKRKSDIATIFPHFKALVENFFQQKIITFYSDNGGEYMGLAKSTDIATYLSTHGISHLTSPPHTPEHNGFSEHRHRHIVDTCFSLLSQASLPLTFWSYTFSTATYLINRLPTPTLYMISPYHKLFESLPNYSNLRSAYLCFDPSTQKVYISRHVQFVESEFPISKVDLHLPRPDGLTCDTWLPRHVILSVSYTSSEVSCSGYLPVDSNTQMDMVDQQYLSLPLYLPFLNPPHTSPTSPNTLPPLLPTLIPTHVPSTSPHVPLALPSPVLNQVSKILSLTPFVCTSPIVTRSQNNIHKPITKLSLLAQLTSGIEFTCVTQALKDGRWRHVMSEEFNALVRNGTWELARLVVKGFHQRLGMDYHETFSPVVKPTTVRVIRSLTVSQGWVLRQLDVNNALLQGTLTEDVLMNQPQGFVDADHPHHVCKLRKVIYGLKKAPRAWYNELRQFLLASHFLNSIVDTSLLILNDKGITIMLLVYVDDIIITCNNTVSVQDFISVLVRRFSLKDLGTLHYFLGVEVIPRLHGLLLS